MYSVYLRAAFIDISELEPRSHTTPIFSMYTATLDTADEAEEFDPFADIEEDEDKLESWEQTCSWWLLSAYCLCEPRKPHPIYSTVV